MVKHTPGCMVSRGSISPHKLPGVAGSLLGNQGFREDMAEYDSLTVSGQCHSSELHKPEREHSVENAVPTSNNNLDLVYRMEHYSPSRASSQPTELPGRPRVQNSEGSLQLEAEAICVPSNSGSDGPSGSGLICIMSEKVNFLAFTAGDQTKKQRQQMPSCRIGQCVQGLPTHCGV